MERYCFKKYIYWAWWHSGGKQVSVSLRLARVVSKTYKTVRGIPKGRREDKKDWFCQDHNFLSGSSDLLCTSHFTNQLLWPRGRDYLVRQFFWPWKWKAPFSLCCYCWLMPQLCWASSVALFQSWPVSFMCLKLNLIDFFDWISVIKKKNSTCI